MKKSQKYAIVFVFIYCFPYIATAQPTALEIVRQSESSMQGKSSVARMRIKIQRSRIKRTMLLESWQDQDSKKSFIRLLKPKKDRGVAFLKIGLNLWQYIPKIGKEIKIEGSLMQDSWMGTDFTNDDLVNATSYSDDYEQTLEANPTSYSYRVRLVPKPTAPVVWGKVFLDVRMGDLLPVEERFFDHKQRLKKITKYSNYKTMGGRKVPTRYEISSLENGRVKSITIMEFLKLEFNAAIPARIFTKENLRR